MGNQNKYGGRTHTWVQFTIPQLTLTMRIVICWRKASNPQPMAGSMFAAPSVAVSGQVVLRTWKKICPSGAFGYPTTKNVCEARTSCGFNHQMCVFYQNLR